jgi:hypothetical protein
MNAFEMRDQVKSAYPSKTWKEKVAKMPDDQIVALYYNFIKRGLIK